MLRTKSLWILLDIGLILLAGGCASTSGTSMPVASTPLPSPTPTTTSVPETSTAEVPARLVIGQPPADNNGGVEGLAFSPDGKALASLYKNGKIVLWDLATRQNIQSFPGTGETGELGMMPGFAFSPDGKSLVSKSDGGTPVLWDVATGQSIEVEKGLVRGNGMALSPDGRLLAYGKCAKLDSLSICDQYEIVLWDMATRQPVGQSLFFDVTARAPLGLLFSPDGQTLAAMSSGTTGSGKIELFDVVTRQPIASPLGGEVQFSSMAFNPDGNSMMLGSIVGVIYMWNMESHRDIATLIGERGLVLGMTFSPDGWILTTRILVPSTEVVPQEKIVLWDMHTFQPIGQPLTGLAATGKDVGLISTAFSPDGRLLASGTNDGTLILWDLATSLHSP